MNDNDATRKRHRVADPLREYADNLANGRVADYEPSIIAQFIHAHANEIDREHDHEIEQLRRLRFREGYEAGQRSMDAEHYAVALRLKHLPLDEDSHGNLSQIARAIWHSDFGWTRGACEALRDELVRLLGGVHDEPAPIPASGCACDADCNCHNQQPQAVAYDSLGNERHKAVCRLRKFEPMIGSKPTEEASKLIRCITGKSDSHVACGNDLEETRDRLIHLLDGDEPLPNFSEPNLPKSAEAAKPESAGGCEVTITDELRKFVAETWDGSMYVNQIPKNLQAIADRIDEQEHKLRKQRDGFKRMVVVANDLLKKLKAERDKLQGKLDEHESRDTAEDIVRDIHLGKVTDSQAVERIKALP